MERIEGQSKGKIVLATVKGDVHDIGKNLVDIILSNNGYTVYNLGIKQPIHDIIKAWREKQADAIGLSGLLVKSVTVMEENLKELTAEGIDVPVLLGGAALSRHYCESHLRPAYGGKCYYGNDAFDGLRVMDHLVSGRAGVLDEEVESRLGKRAAAEEVVARSRAQRQRELEAKGAACGAGRGERGGAAATATIPDPRSATPILDNGQIPTPPFWGTRVVDGIDLDDVYPFINTVALFRGQWQVRKGAASDEEYEALVEDQIRPVFERLKEQCREEAILQPAVVYGYFPAAAEGDDLVVYDPDAPDERREIERFTFPRQEGRQRLCISDFFLPADAGRVGGVDVLGLHCVTVGPRASEAARRLFENNEYQEYLYLHGLGVETAEALAEYWHKRMRQELGIAGDDSPKIRELFTQHYRGSRYSFGYPACPEMSDQEKLWRLLRPERIGCTLTENWQIDPEQSTSAIIVHHPGAKYFNV
jgi:5-methyltetrahydrofolate--homocysteine methyltransferase